MAPRIKALDTVVVNKIAAGEIIVAPANAIKEMLENSIDAGSTTVDVVVKDGGLKLLQIADNGCGIDKDDLPILCERFTTSKLSTFEDLAAIATYGFRGEALASISHIAHVMVTTRTPDSPVGYRATYADGKLVPARPGASAEPKPTAARPGTQIVVEDLFYNVPSRLRAFRSPADEYNRIADVVGRYAIHTAGVGFTCKKQGESQYSVLVPAQASAADRIRAVFGGSIANELVEVAVAADPALGLVGGSGWVTNANYSAKKNHQPVFFINHRLVTCDPLKKALVGIYQAFLPKGGHAFMYVALQIAPDRLDVNVHPTKREVRFMNEDEIVQRVCDALQQALGAVDESRSYKVQTVIYDGPTLAPPSSAPSKRPYEYNLVRTDAKERKITSMFERTSRPDEAEGYVRVERERAPVHLASVKGLRERVSADAHAGLTELLTNHTFVGVVDDEKRLAALQHDVKLFLVDYGALTNELFYQIGLADFANFGVIELAPPLALDDLLRLATDDDVAAFRDSLVDRRDMLDEYFSVQITADGLLTGLPMLIKGYLPSMGKLPTFLQRLATRVDWADETECFRTFMRELALFYVPQSLPDGDVEPSQADAVAAQRQTTHAALEKLLFPAIARRLVATAGLLPSVVEIASLPGLYKVFERC
ncbi:histidine kinase-like ATPase [Dipodascopsis tothii]|uniref:histidine kinase-like ATPase n=1 Tax=Dipodascopsis tothii TaxID=44089 RepID=UPI0034CE0C07